jgi:hypothetical protein
MRAARSVFQPFVAALRRATITIFCIGATSFGALAQDGAEAVRWYRLAADWWRRGLEAASARTESI